MSKITSIATATPSYAHRQDDLLAFADAVFCKDAVESRKLRFLYRQSGIDNRYSVLPDFNNEHIDGRQLFPASADLEPFPGIEKRMEIYDRTAAAISIKAIEDCIAGVVDKIAITHLITVSCTGMSAPGLDLQIMEQMQLSPTLNRTSVNFMGCYAAIHGLKLADAFCNNQPGANVLVVCTELCTLHFQKDATADNMMSSLLFADGSAAMLVQGNEQRGFRLDNFYSEVAFKGKKDMSWQLSAKGFLMTLTGYVPELVRTDFGSLVNNALASGGKSLSDITHYCIHPGGKKILEAIGESLDLEKTTLRFSYDVLRNFGNMSSASIVFVLQEIWKELKESDTKAAMVLGAAFGPGLTMETFLASYE
ncbi:MAG: type III polyketide synthase [Chitinophagaceae bacterium]|nr:MAG: type III polyketide synthase [Chitinophagaceae bacterium]